MNVVLSDHNYYNTQRIQEIRLQQSAVALNTCVIENTIASIMGNKSRPRSLDDAIPINEPIDRESDEFEFASYLGGKKFYRLYNSLIAKDIIKPFMVREFNRNKLYMKALKICSKMK